MGEDGGVEAEAAPDGGRGNGRSTRSGSGSGRSGRVSPPTGRVVRLLDELARRSPEPVSLAELARQLNLAPSTCLGILNELVGADYVVRHAAGPRYSLGPMLVTLGQVAQRSQPALGVAREQITALAAELGAVCTVATVAREEIVVLVRIGRGSAGIEPQVDEGARFPFFAPIGVMFAAWDSDERVAAWLDRAPVEFDEERLDRLRHVITSCREQGWLVERLTEVERTLHRVLPSLVGHPGDAQVRPALTQAAALFAQRDYVVGELTDDGEPSVSVVCAPTFTAEGRPDLVLSVYVMRDHVPGAEVRRVAEALRRCSDAVTRSVGGYDPWRAAAASG
jgi:DNA-binding IclR family transcriptional regulator